MNKILLSFLFLFLSGNLYSQTYWRIKNEKNEELLLTVKIDQQKQSFVAYSRKNALKDIAGAFTYYAARTAGILKYPEIIHIEGKVSVKRDTTVYSGTLIRYDDSYQFSAKTVGNKFSGEIEDAKGRTKLLQGKKIYSDKPLRDYASLIDKSFSITEKYYWDKNLINLSEWQSFKEKLDDIKFDISDDYELNAAIFWYRKKLPFPKYEIQKNRIRKNEPSKNKKILPKEIKPVTMLIDIDNIPAVAEDMDLLFDGLRKNHCVNLIIDMRGRKKAQMSQALFLANHLVNYSTLWGIYLTQKGTNNFNPLPNPTEYEKVLSDYRQIIRTNEKLYLSTGFYMRIKPAVPAFEGKIYLLIDQKTSGVAEALAIFLRNENIATTVGEKSSGSPMLREMVPVDKDYYLSLQIAQFFAGNGKSYKNQYIEPDRNVTDEDSLSYLLKMIN